MQRCRNACKPERGIETAHCPLVAWEQLRRNACKPERGIETLSQMTWEAWLNGSERL